MVPSISEAHVAVPAYSTSNYGISLDYIILVWKINYFSLTSLAPISKKQQNLESNMVHNQVANIL